MRFGDPETQALVPRIRGDFAQLLFSAARGACDAGAAHFDGDACVGIVLATAQYPQTNTPLGGLSADVALGPGCAAFWGASTLRDGTVDASGGRVLTVTATGADVAQARERGYAAVGELTGRLGAAGGDHALQFRHDIAAAPPDHSAGLGP